MPKNVLWNKYHQPFIIDWEFSGLVNPDCELFDVAFNWNRSQTTSVSSKVIAGCLGNWLSWAAFNIKRTFWENISVREVKIAEHQIVQTLANIKLVSKSVFGTEI